ncbi:general substrate transporter [Kalaharituber pfeilii]|nr:general substrate transporter [Kalaharituber pfeilii]
MDINVDPPRTRLLFLVVLSCFGAAYFGYSSGVIGGCIELPAFQRSFKLPPRDSKEFNTIASNIVSFTYIGTLVGSLAVIPLVEKLGPRIGLAVSAGIFVAGCAMQTWSGGELNLMYSGRVVAGLGMGGSTAVGPMYISEISPALIRGFLVGIHEISFQITTVFGFWINYGVNRTIPPSSSAQWMIPLGIQLVPGIILFIISLLVLPESPRYLVRKNHIERAQAVLGRIRELPPDHPDILSEMHEIKAHFDMIQITTRTQDTRFAGVRGILLSPTMRARVASGCLMMLFLNLTGAVALNSYLPSIFRTLGFNGTGRALMLNGLFAALRCLSVTLSSVFLVDRYGRKVLLIVSAIGVSGVMWYLGAFVTVDRPNPGQDSHSSSIPGYIALACIFLFGFFFGLSSQVPWIYCAEIFPTHLRSIGVSLTTTAQFAAEFLVSKCSPYMLTNIRGGAFFVFAACTAVMVGWVAWCVPETKGRTLEAMEEAFSRRGRRSASDAHAELEKGSEEAAVVEADIEG